MKKFVSFMLVLAVIISETSFSLADTSKVNEDLTNVDNDTVANEIVSDAALDVSQSETDNLVAYPVEGGNIYFDKSTGTITSCDGSVVCADIPSEINGVRVTSIEEKAFFNVYTLSSVIIPDSVINIDTNTFYCIDLTDIIVDENNEYYKSIDGVLFNKDGTRIIQYPQGKSQSEYKIPNSVIIIGDYAFSYCKNLMSIVIPDSVVNIGNNAFSDCFYLKNITIPDSVTNIGDYAFYDCDRLESVVMSNSITSIGDGIFCHCRDLKNITIPDSVKSIGKAAFRECYSLENFVIPNSVTSIGNVAFYSCNSLINIIIPNSVVSLGNNVFDNCRMLKSIIISSSVTNIGENIFNSCINLTDIIVDDNNKYYKSIDGVLFNKACTELVSYPKGKELTKYIIPDSVIRIGDYGFNSCSNLINIIIPDSVISIGKAAFLGCSFTNLLIPDSVVSIDDGAFKYCHNLKGIILPDSVIIVGMELFSSCHELTSVKLSNSITKMEACMFYNCRNLKKVIIPASVIEIDPDTFFESYAMMFVYRDSYADKWAQNQGWEVLYVDEVENDLLGDANLDGKVDAIDVACVMQKNLLDTYNMPCEYKYGSDFVRFIDVSGDGIINSQDAAMILQKSLDSTFKFNIE